MDLEVRVEGVADVRLTRQIERSLRLIARRETRSGEWTMLVAPSENRGEWDIGVRSPGRHLFASFRAEPRDLPGIVDQQFRAALAAAAPT
jgi:hypothetical protein